MELRHIYSIATSLSDTFNGDEMIGADINDLEVNVKVSPSTLYAIDREFYRQTHDNSTDGFTHYNKVEADIGNVHFVITEKPSQGQIVS